MSPDDVYYDATQKGVDMRIGIDIAAMAFKKQVDQMILVSGDSDFVPAAKLARREGIDFILDPMWAPIRADLNEHVDGIRSVIPKPTPAFPIGAVTPPVPPPESFPTGAGGTGGATEMLRKPGSSSDDEESTAS